jgi:hypothetical protein
MQSTSTLGRRCHRPRSSGSRMVTSPPQYRFMKPSPPRVPEQSLPSHCCHRLAYPASQDLGRLVGPPEGASPFTMAAPRRTPGTEEGRGSLAVERLTRGTTDLSIIDRPTTSYHRVDPPSLTSEEANPNPNGLGSGSSP